MTIIERPDHAKGGPYSPGHDHAAARRRSGWIEAGLFVLAISILNMVYAIANAMGADVVVFVLYATAFAAIAMLAITGLGQDWRAVIAARQSWIFGGTTVAMEGFYYALVATTTPTEAALLMRLSVPASILVGWMLFGRAVERQVMVGMAVVIAGVVPILFGVPSEHVPAAIALTLICALIVSVKTFASEFHPWNRAAETLNEKLRVTGLVVLATGVLGFAVLIPSIALTQAGVLPQTGVVPEPEALWHGPTLILAILIGAPLLFAMNYLTFSSVVKISTENFLATSAFTPLTTLALQFAAVALGLISAPSLAWWLVPFIFVGIAGVLIIVHARRYADD